MAGYLWSVPKELQEMTPKQPIYVQIAGLQLTNDYVSDPRGRFWIWAMRKQRSPKRILL